MGVLYVYNHLVPAVREGVLRLAGIVGYFNSVKADLAVQFNRWFCVLPYGRAALCPGNIKYYKCKY